MRPRFTDSDISTKHASFCESIAREHNWSRESCLTCAAAHDRLISSHVESVRNHITISLTDGLGNLIWSGEFTTSTTGNEFHSLERLQLEAAESLHQGVKAKLTAEDIIHEEDDTRDTGLYGRVWRKK